MLRPPAIVMVSFLLHFTLGDDMSEGDACQVARSDAPGTCKSLIDCQSAINELHKGFLPARCGWKGDSEIVCCQNPPTSRSRVDEEDRLSVRKCIEYEDYAFEKTFVATGFNSPPIIKKSLKCWSSNVPLVVGGMVAKEKEFPHMALVGYRPGFGELNFGCGGSLISDRFVLTAAHCIFTSKLVGPPKLIRLGEHDHSTTNDDAAVVDIDVEQTYPHPLYTKTEKYNDIGLIKMVKPVEFNQYVRPACLSDVYSVKKPIATATGWGKTDYRSAGSNVLMKVVLEVYSDDECQQHFLTESQSSQLKRGIEARTQFCAGSRTEKKDVCQGDSGGPLQIRHPNRTCIFAITGVTSFGKRCSESSSDGTSGIYTRVYAYLDWIEGIVWPENA